MTWSIYAHGTKEGVKDAIESYAKPSGGEEEVAVFEQVRSMLLTAIGNAPVPGPDYYKRPQLVIFKIQASGHGSQVSSLEFKNETIVAGATPSE